MLLFAQSNKNDLSDAQKVYGLSKLCSEAKYNFVYYNKLPFDWDSLCMASIPAILNTKTDFDYAMEMKRICAKLGDGHTLIWVNNFPDRNDWITPLPITTIKFGNRIFVDEVYSKDFILNGINKGTEILQVNGMRAYDYGVKNVMPYISSSTTQWTDYEAFCSFEFTKGRMGDSISLVYKDLNGKKHDITLSRKLKWDNEQSRETYQYKLLPNNISYLRITTFNDPKSMQKFDSVYDKLKNSSDLIIDLRNNGGGNSSYADYILRHLSKTPFKSDKWRSPMYIPAHASWGYPDEWYEYGCETLYPVNKDIYTNPVVVLVNNGTFSSSEDFCMKFRGMKRGKIVGTKTGGSSGNGVRMEIVKGIITANFCSKQDLGCDGTEFIGIGIIPDVEAENTLTDFVNNKDVVLEKAIETVKE